MKTMIASLIVLLALMSCANPMDSTPTPTARSIVGTWDCTTATTGIIQLVINADNTMSQTFIVGGNNLTPQTQTGVWSKISDTQYTIRNGSYTYDSALDVVKSGARSFSRK
jgi:hypothetical protein